MNANTSPRPLRRVGLLCLLLLTGARRETPRKAVLLVASYVFYMAWNPVFVLLIIGSTAIDFVIGGRLAREQDPLRPPGRSTRSSTRSRSPSPSPMRVLLCRERKTGPGRIRRWFRSVRS